MRRRALLAAMAATPLAAAGCTGSNQAPTQTATAQADGLKESPFLKGKGFPPLEERLPSEPKLADDYPGSYLTPELGSYGGEIRTSSISPGFDPEVFIFNLEGILGTPGYLGEEITANVVKSYEMSADQQTFTFNLRKGMKWSDGKPVTMDDVKFAVEDVLFNKELTPTLPTWAHAQCKATNTPGKFTFLDDWAFSIAFDKPYPGLLIQLAIVGWATYTSLIKPRHVLTKYHKKYAEPAELAKLVKQAGLEAGNWVGLFTAKDVVNFDTGTPTAIGFPSLSPWLLVSTENNVNRYERNPYYWKVDAQGRQLPYIDTVRSDLVSDVNIMQVNTLAGQYDFLREQPQLKDFALYTDNADRGGYTPQLMTTHGNAALIYLNLTHKDPAWSRAVLDVRFRRALDMALDKNELRDTVFFGHATVSPFSSTTRDVDQANALLDEIGLKRGPDGRRVGSDGQPFAIPFDIGQQSPNMAAIAELVKPMWEEVGFNVTIKVIDNALWTNRVNANDYKATVTWDSGTWYEFSGFDNVWAPLWFTWLTSGGKSGQKPPADAAAYFELEDKRWVVDNKTAAGDLWKQLRQSVGENLWRYRLFDETQQVVIMSSRMRNVTNKGYSTALNSAAELWFYGAK